MGRVRCQPADERAGQREAGHRTAVDPEQAASLGGKLEIVSGPAGTRLELSVPLVLAFS